MVSCTLLLSSVDEKEEELLDKVYISLIFQDIWMRLMIDHGMIDHDMNCIYLEGIRHMIS